MQYWHPILCRVEEDINVFLASFLSYLHTVIPSFPLCMLTTCHLSLTFSQQPLTLLFSWFQSIPAWVPMYMWGFVCTRGSLSWIEWSLAAVCSLPISEIAVRFNTVNEHLSNVNLLSYYYYRGRITFFRDMISTPWVVSVWLVEQGLSVGNANFKRTHQLSCSSFQAWGQFIPSMEGEGEMVYRGATGFGCRSLEFVWNISVNTTVPILDCSPTSHKTIRGGKDHMPYLWSLQFQLLDCFPT